MNNTYKLKTMGIGSKFTYGGVSWVLLQKTKAAAVCLAEKILFNKAFDENNNNNWAESSLRKYLNGEFLDSLAVAGAEKAAFLPFTGDLTADDGLKDYSNVKDRISLITCDQYRKHRYTIPNADDWWLTATAFSTASNGYSNNVRGVYTCGALDSGYAGSGSYGVRPLCNLQSSILVSVNEHTGYEPDEEPKEEPEKEQQAKPLPIEHTSEIKELHKTALQQAYKALLYAQNLYIKNIDGKNSQSDTGQLTAALATLAATSKIELKDEEKAELGELHAAAIKASYDCVRSAQEKFIADEAWEFPNTAAALATLQTIIQA